MIRFLYAALSPPGPMVYVVAANPATGTKRLPALLDTAADRSVLPGAVVRSLGLTSIESHFFKGFGGEIRELPVYDVTFELPEHSPAGGQPLLGEDEPYILLGRDVLNQFKILLDGPGLALEIE
jgi:hypothetical protein